MKDSDDLLSRLRELPRAPLPPALDAATRRRMGAVFRSPRGLAFARHADLVGVATLGLAHLWWALAQARLLP
jgi:hypothetical protein